MSRKVLRLLLTAGPVPLALVASQLSCGSGGAVCGDGHLDEGELCDDGNRDDSDFCQNDCTPRSIPRLTVKWEFNKDVASGFSGDSCTDLGIDRVVVELESETATLEGEELCSFRQVVFTDLPVGEYDVKLRPLTEEGELLTGGPVEESYPFQGGSREELVINVPPEAWSSSYEGTFFFRVSWAGADCDEATPPVSQQELTLRRGNAPVDVETTDGDPMDGSAPSPCRSLSEDFPQSALGVPFGRAELTVVGLDEQGEPAFEGVYDTFVGAGANNPELLFEVSSLRPDAGAADAGPPDAGPPDAGPPNAGPMDASVAGP